MSLLLHRHPASTAPQRVALGLNHLSVIVAGLVPAIHVFLSMDARDKPAHDEGQRFKSGENCLRRAHLEPGAGTIP